MILTGRKFRSLAAPLLLAVLAGCGGQPADGGKFATSKILYFQVNCPHPGHNCLEVKQLLQKEIPRYKYTFTYGSYRIWPYYKAFGLDEKVPRDSLFPPHSYMHQLVPIEERPFWGGGEFLVDITLYTKSDTIPDYIVNVYRLDVTPPELAGSSSLQPVQQRPGMTLSTPEIILKSVIRYSYK